MQITVIFGHFPTMWDFSENESYIVGKKFDKVKFRNFPTTKVLSCCRSYIVGKYADCHDIRTLPHNEGFFREWILHCGEEILIMISYIVGKNFDWVKFRKFPTTKDHSCWKSYIVGKHSNCHDIRALPHNEGFFMLSILHWYPTLWGNLS